MMTIHKYPDWELISNFEMDMIADNGETCGVVYGLHDRDVLASANEIYWTVYQRFNPDVMEDKFGGRVALADCTTKNEADQLHKHWSDTFEIIKAVMKVKQRLKQ